LKVDLLSKEYTKKELFEAIKSCDLTKVESIHIFHTASKIKNELPGVLLEDGMPDPKFTMIDHDNDGIDDEVLKCTLHTFVNTQLWLNEILVELWQQNKPKFFNIIWALVDKKDWIPTSHSSMIKANRMLREYLNELTKKDKTIQGVCTSVWTIATASELGHRKFWESDYWLQEKEVVNTIIEKNKKFEGGYSDQDIFSFNPRYESYYKTETDAQMTERFKREYGLPYKL